MLISNEGKGWGFRMTVLWVLLAAFLASMSFLMISYGRNANVEREKVVKNAINAIAQAEANNAQINRLLNELQYVKDVDQMNMVLRKYIGPPMQTTNETKERKSGK